MGEYTVADLAFIRKLQRVDGQSQEIRKLTERIAWYIEERKVLARQVGIHDPSGADHMEEAMVHAERADRLEAALRRMADNDIPDAMSHGAFAEAVLREQVV